MEKAIEVFVTYLKDVMKKSENTIASYAGDLGKLNSFFGATWNHR